MSVIQIQGLRPLKGEIKIQGSKNTVLPVLAASLLHKGTTVITNVPRIQDVTCMLGILRFLGCECSFEGNVVVINAKEAVPRTIPESEGKRMRSSILLLGPMLGRFREVQLGFPGGCVIGRRPVDFHFNALQRMGAMVETDGNRIIAKASRLSGCCLRLEYPSVGATENILMAACGARGTTVLSGAAKEPEIVMLCRFLEMLGVQVTGAGSDCICICGSQTLHDCEFAVPGDRIVAGTYLGAVMTVGGDVYLRDAPVNQMEQVFVTCQGMGTKMIPDKEGVRVVQDRILQATKISTAPYPGFPTDLQSVMLAVATQAEGVTQIEETIFEERFATAKELRKLGAHIIIDGRCVNIQGRRPLHGNTVCARDLRGGAALAVAGLAAEGGTVIEGYNFIKRGYEDICRDLRAVGAQMSLDCRISS